MPLVLFRRELLAVAAALPALGCTLNTEGTGSPGNDADNETGNDTSTAPEPPFDHKAILNLTSVSSLERAFTLYVTFEAAVTGPIATSRIHKAEIANDPNNPLALPHPIEDDSVISLEEAGTVTCTCTFVFEAGNEDVVPSPPNPPVPHDKLADQDLPAFELSFVSPEYVLT